MNGRWAEFHATALVECVFLLRVEQTNVAEYATSRGETSLRAPNNYVFPTDYLVMTLAKWYQFYNRPEYRDMYIVVPKQTQRKGKTNSNTCFFSVELYINIPQVRYNRFVFLLSDPDTLAVYCPHWRHRDCYYWSRKAQTIIECC